MEFQTAKKSKCGVQTAIVYKYIICYPEGVNKSQRTLENVERKNNKEMQGLQT